MYFVSDRGILFEDLQPFPTILQDERRRGRVRPSVPKSKGRPSIDGPRSFGTTYSAPSADQDPELHRVADELLRLDPDGTRTAVAIRRALDQVYDGRRTGRWDFTQLMKTEKTHVGTLVEIWIAREFEFSDGTELDFKISGVDVDCKWSMNLYGWEIPREMYERGPKIAYVLWGSEYSNRWASGLVRTEEENLRPLGKQRDQKRRLNEVGRDRILWVHRDGAMIQNVLVHYPEIALDVASRTSGQDAVNTLFRRLQGVLINQATVETAAQQTDSGKRVRDARSQLKSEGIAIFGHYRPHPDMASDLGLPRPSLGRFVSARLAPWEGEGTGYTTIAGSAWRLAHANDPPTCAPKLPRQGTEQV